MSHIQQSVRTNADMEVVYGELCRWLHTSKPLNRGEVHAQKTTSPEMFVHELFDVSLTFQVDNHPSAWAETIQPNLPWAEDHFQERVDGHPFNPPPSEQWWPFAQQGNAAHKAGEKFSHTYPERFWPKMANLGGTIEDTRRQVFVPHVGIRYQWGDLEDLIMILRKNPLSRQAYLPIWFPEDLDAAKRGHRVPCSLGYHFLVDGDNHMNMTYTLRSCDIVRFYRDDMYMAGRLLQWVSAQIPDTEVGTLTAHIFNLHAFVGDDHFLLQHQQSGDKRNNYNLGALF